MSDRAKVSLESLTKEGWVDDLAKIGLDVGEGTPENIRHTQNAHENGEIPDFNGGDQEQGGESMNENARCPIWNTSASETPSGHYDGRLMDSPRAGGEYSISRTAIACLPEDDERLKARLTSWLIEQRRSGVECPGISSTTVEQAEQHGDLPVYERADRLLQYFGKQTAEIGNIVWYTRQNLTEMALASSESIDMDEVRYLLRYFEGPRLAGRKKICS